MRLYFQARKNGEGVYGVRRRLCLFVLSYCPKLFEAHEGRHSVSTIKTCFTTLQILAVDELHYYTGMLGRYAEINYRG